METATQRAQQAVAEKVEQKMAQLTKGEVPSNVEIAEQLEALKLGPEVDRQRLSETGQAVHAWRWVRSGVDDRSIDLTLSNTHKPVAVCSSRRTWTSSSTTRATSSCARTATRISRMPPSTPRGPPRSRATTSC